VLVWLTVRRFFCDHVDCSACTFVEQVPGLTGLTERRARRSSGLHSALVAVALALAGRAGSRLAAALGMAVSRSTLLRLIRGLPDPPVGRVRVLGVDEFALRRRHHYGTVLVDLAGGHRPVDVLTGREAGDFAGWLRTHPGVEVICRDRAGAYADGAREGAPDAIQVADRWHLWDNLCQQVERLVAAHHACLPEPVDPAPDTGPDLFDVVPLWPDTVRIENTRQRYDHTHELRARGLSMRAIARKLDLNFKTVRRYLRADSVDILLAGGVRASVLDPFKPYLHERIADGQRNATLLLVESPSVFGVGFAAPDRTRSHRNTTCSSSRSDSPVCSASSITGTQSGAGTRFSSLNRAAPRPQAGNNLTESVLPIRTNPVCSKPIGAGQSALSSCQPPAISMIHRDRHSTISSPGSQPRRWGSLLLSGARS
jgi:hypothetical protein